ncbi:MAG: type II CRISPR RNA-guided endonuclease Cas9, partial [Erysipelotrichales bacterium]
HLRKYLCETKEKVDPRLIYLALHHIVKHRGNFLYEGQKFEISDDSEVKQNLTNALNVIFEDEDAVYVDEEVINKVMICLLDTRTKKSIRKETIVKYFTDKSNTLKPKATELTNILIGYESNLTKLFPDKDIQKDEKDYKTNFSSTKYEDNISEIESMLDDKFETIEELHKVYSFILLKTILNGEKLICDALCVKYENHGKELKELRTLVKNNYSVKDYYKLFKDEGVVGSYKSYIEEPGKTKKRELYDFINKLIESNDEVKSSSTGEKILAKIEMDNYLEKQSTTDNGAIPYQLHELELLTILNNQKKYYDEINEETIDKIDKVFKFRIPYYVGPLSKENNSFAWMIRKDKDDDEKLYPWNFEEKVDLIESAEAFIRRMTNTCTYLLSEDVVPKKSLLYSRYEVLNELNKIRVDSKLLANDAKKACMNELFMMRKSVTSDALAKFLISKQFCTPEQCKNIRGFQKDKEFSTSLEPWIDFKKIYEEDFEKNYEEIEVLIEWISVYEDKKILKSRIEKSYPEIYADKKKLNSIIKLRYTGWGRLSKKLLVGLKGTNKQGESVSIMDVLEKTNMNFMQVINDEELGFKKLIENAEIGELVTKRISYDQIEMLQGSPAIKRGIWQTTCIIEEITKMMGCEPEFLYLEFARSDDENVRTSSKVKKLLEIYKTIKDDCKADAEFNEAYTNLKKENTNSKIDSERLYLYYLQEGKCLYSGKPLDIDKLSFYEVDHIIPQTYLKDDSYDNKALVLKVENQYKSDKLLLNHDLVSSRFTWWSKLKKCGLMSEKKFKSLTKENLSELEEVGFINRQLVETRQITKHVANIFKNRFDETTVVSIKASLSSNFREKFDIVKLRDLNDYHHAHDAYLATVIGTFVMKRYPTLKKEFIFTDYNEISSYNRDSKKMINNYGDRKNKYGFIINQFSDEVRVAPETGEICWNGSSDLNKVLKCFDYNDCFITKKLQEQKNQFFNLTLKTVKELSDTSVLSNNSHKVIPVNNDRSDINKYGGFTTLNYAYAIAIEFSKGKKTIRTIVNVPIIYANNEALLFDFICKDNGCSEFKVLKRKILFNQLLNVDGALIRLASASEWNNAQQLVLSKDSKQILATLFNDKKDIPCDEDLLFVYDEYCQKLLKHYPHYESLYKKFIACRHKVVSLNDKKTIFLQMLVLTKASKSTANIKQGDFEIGPTCGRMTCKKANLNEICFISQSITGMNCKKEKL